MTCYSNSSRPDQPRYGSYTDLLTTFELCRDNFNLRDPWIGAVVDFPGWGRPPDSVPAVEDQEPRARRRGSLR